ncbi:Nudix hydrolase incomplete domain containing protein [Pandoravirus macleodensis]|uniref:Nudix hydrolase incomplete domain containing protein n=1 Tax=Pandoravirus macleodensis TaxID=2107707 RepID=A0A2U7UEU1_9VIRU|nr:MutT/NUDIX hydrolase [Pandoravirus macleodensis]AVK76978.1 Nudix hydrolase incomplete domain containing protein [Pandoravirus macleodensis]
MLGRSPRCSPRDPVETHAATSGASILCYAVAPHTGELFFLLGKESGGAADARLDCDPTCSWSSATRRSTKEDANNDRAPRKDGDICATGLDGVPLHAKVASTTVDQAPARSAYSVECDDSDDSDSVYTSSSDPSQDSDDDRPEDDGGQPDEQTCSQDGTAHCTADAPNVNGVACQPVALDSHTPSSPLKTVAKHDAHNVAQSDMYAWRGAVPSPNQRRLRRTHRWCDFGGRIEPGESQEEAAAREFFEETLGVVCTDSCARSAHRDAAMGSVDVGAPSGLHGETDRRALAADLAAGRYAFKVRTCLNHGADPMVPRRYHVTFVKRIPWTPSVVLQFARLRCELAAMARDARRDRAPADESDMDCMPATPVVDTDQVGGLAASIDNSSHRAAKQHDANSDRAVNKWLMSDEPAARAALRPDGRVRDECIEKDYLQFWSVRRLRHALDNGGCFRREHLRPLFMPTIAVVLDVMAPRRVHRNVANAPVVHDDDVPWHPSTRLTLERVDGASVYTVRCRAPQRRVHYPVQAHAHSQELDACVRDSDGGHARERHDSDGNDNSDDSSGQHDTSPAECDPLSAAVASWRYKPDTRCVLN